MRQVFNFFWQSISKYRVYYILMLIAPVMGACYKPIVYYAIKMMIDIITTAQNLSLRMLMPPLLIYVVADLVLSGLWRSSQVFLWKSEPYVQQGILLRALQKLLSYHYHFFQNTASGSLISKIKGLFDGYTELWAQLYYGVTFWILASITTGFSILWINLKLGGILAAWSVMYIIINYFLSKRINQLSQLQNNAKHVVIGELADSISNIHSVKLFATRKYEYNRLKNKIASDFVPKEVKLYKFHFKVGILNDILGIGIIIVMLLLMIQLKRMNQITIGDFVFVFSMVFQLQENLWHLMQEFHKLSDRMGDLKSSLSIYEVDQSEYAGDLNSSNSSNDNHAYAMGAMPSIEMPSIEMSNMPSIEFKDIWFKYNDNKTVFSGLNLIIQPGERVGIVGFTGSGKTTLVNLLLKIFIPQQGSILIDNQDIAHIDCDFLRQHIAIIPQDIALFHRNLMENIRYGKLDATDDEVILASKSAHADEFISKLSQDYKTMVGERGMKLSGGQRQRIAIARAILKSAPILVLDEATSALDSVTEQYIQESIQELLEGKTVLAIAHRLSTLKNMDRLIIVDDGRIIEQGTHDELLKVSGSLYSKIWHTQYAQTD
ncbi:MAG: ATP-binding cassette, subfamily bacterial [Pseudomonadota bacterium]|nr:ATP-binding cassette, subfamily bacterial [Pseudomonadota bacterium]